MVRGDKAGPVLPFFSFVLIPTYIAVDGPTKLRSLFGFNDKAGPLAFLKCGVWKFKPRYYHSSYKKWSLQSQAEIGSHLHLGDN